ncbi:MAG: ribonuclease PH [Myxococcales bacterium]|nr:ribonuclease PH [Myxococcales bacterium]
MSERPDGRGARDLRTPTLDVGFHRPSEGSVLYRAGNTVVLCTASVDAKTPPFLEGTGKGWVTGEYQMHPRANPPRRESRDGRKGSVSGRTQEIQRLIGRSLRAAVLLDRLGERTISIDCDVLEADGGTRTASITGGFVALALALDKLRKKGDLAGPVLRAPVAAISVGWVKTGLALDLIYVEDSKARVDLNVVATEAGDIVEIQGTAEDAPVPRKDVDTMVDLGPEGISRLCAIQRASLLAHGVDLSTLIVREAS